MTLPGVALGGNGDDHALAAGPFGGEKHQVGLKGRQGGGEEVGPVAGGPGAGEGVHQAPVAAAVAAAGGGVPGGQDLQGLGRAGEEVVDPDPLAVAFQLAVGAEQPGPPVAAGVEAGHHERAGGAAVELHRHHLVVDHVVVAAVDAAPVGTGAQRRQQVLLAVALDDGVQRPAGAALQAARVEAHGRVRAGRLDPAVEAAVGRPGRPVLGPEVGEGAEAGHAADRPPDHVLQPVEVVAGLGHEHEGGRPLPPPGAADVGVGLVEEPDRLQVLDRDHLAQAPGVHHLLHQGRVGGVAQDVADREDHPGPLHRPDDAPAVGLGGGHRLLQEHVVAELGEGDRRVGVHRVLGADQDGVGHLAPGGQLLPGGDVRPVGEAVPGGEAAAPHLLGLGHGHHPGPVRVGQRPVAVGVPAVAGAEDGQGDGCHGMPGQGPARSGRAWRSPGVGRDAWAPGRRQAAAATRTARRAASSRVAPPARASASPPQKASPAAVVSTARTGTAGTWVVRPGSITRQPSAPRVTTTARAGSLPASRVASATVPGSAPPASWASSTRLGTSTSTSATSSSGRSRTGAGLSTTVPPAARAAAATASSGTSSWSRVTVAAPRAASAWPTSSGVRRALAPGLTTIWFSPSSLTVMRAMPLGTPATTRTCAVSTASASSDPSSSRPASSPPTRPTMATRRPSRAAATAWLAPLPPGLRNTSSPETVSPGPGSRATRTTRSRLRLPTTATSGSAATAPCKLMASTRDRRRPHPRLPDSSRDRPSATVWAAADPTGWRRGRWRSRAVLPSDPTSSWPSSRRPAPRRSRPRPGGAGRPPGPGRPARPWSARRPSSGRPTPWPGRPRS